jgi:hypothetical protein
VVEQEPGEQRDQAGQPDRVADAERLPWPIATKESGRSYTGCALVR